jgi:hypothetical protein
MKRTIGLVGAAVVAVLASALPAQAITNGTADAGAHPMVGQLFYYNPGGYDSRFSDTSGNWYSCTGTLVDETHVVTAGHCTYPIGSGGTDVWFDVTDTPDLSSLPPSDCFADAAGYTPDPAKTATCAGLGVTTLGQGNDARAIAWRAALNASSEWIHATAYTSPEYNSVTYYMDDLGVLVLDAGIVLDTYASLPSQGLVDQLYSADKNATYTVVGYGRQGSSPLGDWGGGTRYDGTVAITNTKGVWGLGKGPLIALSSNNGKPHQGGTCYGDSGGPAFPNDPQYANTIITVTSFGVDPYCNAGTGAYRLDQPDALAFLADFGITPVS